MALADSGRRSKAERVAYVLKYGSFLFGGSMAVISFVYDSYQQNVWGSPREFVHLLAFWCVFGVLFGIAQLRRDERPNRPERTYRGAA